MGHGVPQGGPGHFVRAHTGGQLFGHQGPARRHVQNSGQHDQEQDARGDTQDIQYQEWLHARRRGASTQGKRMVRREIEAGRLHKKNA